MDLSAVPAQVNAFHVLTKPTGPICNLDCKYCFYLEKENLYSGTSKWAMPDDILESYVRQYIESQRAPVISFAWQGGEPTLLGVDFFREGGPAAGQVRGGEEDRERLSDQRGPAGRPLGGVPGRERIPGGDLNRRSRASPRPVPGGQGRSPLLSKSDEGTGLPPGNTASSTTR